MNIFETDDAGVGRSGLGNDDIVEEGLSAALRDSHVRIDRSRCGRRHAGLSGHHEYAAERLNPCVA